MKILKELVARMPRKKYKVIPLYDRGCSTLDTVEGIAVSNKVNWETFRAFQRIFRSLPPSIRHPFAFFPKKGDCVKRFRFWIAVLKPNLSPAEYYPIIHAIYSCYMSIMQRQIQESKGERTEC